MARQHTVNSNYMCLIESGYKQVSCVHLTTNMHLITRIYGITFTFLVATRDVHTICIQILRDELFVIFVSHEIFILKILLA